MNVLKGRLAGLCVVGLALGSGLLGCSSPQVQQSFSEADSKKPQDQRSASSNTASSTKDTNSAPESRPSATEENAPASTASPVSVSEPETVASGSLPAGYTLDENCQKGIGQTGLDIYYLLPPSDSLRYACIHRVDRSPLINYADSAFAQTLAEVGGPYCAFSSVSDNVGCALSPISTTDLMNVAPPQKEEEQEKEQPAASQQSVQPKQPQQSKEPAQSDQPPQSKQPTTAEQQPPPSPNGTCGLSNDNSYTNSKGNDVHSPANCTDGSVPPGATAQCNDGSYSFSESRRGSCSSHGGVARLLP